MKSVSFILDNAAMNNNNTNNQNQQNSNNNTNNIDWVDPVAERFSTILSNSVILPVAPWSDAVRCVVVSSFLDCVVIELEQTVWTKRFDLAGALKFDQDLRQLRNFFSTEIDLDVPVREKFRRLAAMTSVLLAERKSDISGSSNNNILNSSDVANLIKLRVDPPV